MLVEIYKLKIFVDETLLRQKWLITKLAVHVKRFCSTSQSPTSLHLRIKKLEIKFCQKWLISIYFIHVSLNITIPTDEMQISFLCLLDIIPHFQQKI